MYACICHPTTDAEVAEVIASGADSVEAVGEACGAGTGCGSCHDRIQDAIEAARRLPADCPLRQLIAA